MFIIVSPISKGQASREITCYKHLYSKFLS